MRGEKQARTIWGKTIGVDPSTKGGGVIYVKDDNSAGTARGGRKAVGEK